MESDNSLVERRKEMMVSLVVDDDDDETTPILREAHFIKPSIDSESQLPPNPPLALALTIEPKKRRIKLDKGWVYPTFEWKTWVHHLLPKFQYLWKEVGIFEAIMSSTQNIEKDENLIMAIAEKWCPETNTIVFPWGEATITLEDVMVLGGYSVSGYSIPSSVSEPELKEIEQKLKNLKVEIGRGSHSTTSTSAWLKKFIKSGSEIEHEAFLTYWIARFVFPISVRTVKDCFFPIAIHLARGSKHVALRPAVLASIYNDFKVLKEAIVASGTKFDNGENVFEVKVWSPLCLVQMWAFERFPDLRGRPNTIKLGDPRAALWNEVKMLKVENIRSVLDSGGETFRWRPYATATMNWQLPKFYRDKAEWVRIDSETDKEISSYVFCLRPSELVGIECIEQYSPHRVAMQFGIDQDIPGHIDRCNENAKIAWKYYGREETKLYLPSRYFEADVTTRYLKWWKHSVSVQPHENEIDDVIKSVASRKRSIIRQSKRAQCVPTSTVEEKTDNVPPVQPSECNSALLEGFTIEKKRKICSFADILGPRQQNEEFVTSQLQGPTNVESPGAAPDHAIVMDLMAKQSITQKEETVAEFDVLSSDSKHEDIMNLQDKLADNNSATPPDFTPKSARKMVKDVAVERSTAPEETSKVGKFSMGGINNGRISADTDVFSKSMPVAVGETQTSGGNGARFGLLTTKTLVNSSNESGVGSSVAVAGNVVLWNKDENSPSTHEIILGFELERKISKLERIFDALVKIYADDPS